MEVIGKAGVINVRSKRSDQKNSRYDGHIAGIPSGE
jgi:hypothetical protein